MDKHFPGLKERYIKEFGNRYELTSCNNKNLMNYFYSVCKENKDDTLFSRYAVLLKYRCNLELNKEDIVSD